MKSQVSSYASRALLSIAASVGVEETALQASSLVTEEEDVASANDGSYSITNVSKIPIEDPEFFKQGIKRPGSDAVLHLNVGVKPKVFLLDFSKIILADFGVEVSANNVSIDLASREIWREFLRIEQHAKCDALTSQERKQWQDLLHIVDYARYRAESAPLVRVVGELVSRMEDSVVVRWHGGSDGQETVGSKFYDRFDLVNSGESFSAMARFVDLHLVAVEDVRPETEIVFGESDLSWIA